MFAIGRQFDLTLTAFVLSGIVGAVMGAEPQVADKSADSAAKAPTIGGPVAPVQTRNQILPTPDYTGDLWTRSTLTGDWGGTRQEWANKGFTIDGTLTQVGMGVVSGGVNNGWEYLGRGEININLDTTKMGLWPGGLFTLTAEGHFGRAFSGSHAGALVPVNMNEAIPEIDDSFVLSRVMYTQFLSEQVGVFMGKLNTVTANSGDMNEFAHGKGDSGFLNTAFCANPVSMLTIPYSTTGAGIMVLPDKDLMVTAAVVDPHGRADSAQFDDMFLDGVTVTGEARYTTHFFGMTGHQLVGGTYSSSRYFDSDQRLANLILPNLPTEKTSGSWSVYWNFDQYVYQPDPKADKGVGVFARAGLSDGHANPIHWFASLGIGGKGMITGRPHDSFGIGYYYAGMADTNIASRLGFGDAQGVEAFYDIAITPWLHLTPDLQWVQPSQERVDASFIVGFRLTMAF